jgi:multiple sugar transport system permease protein
MGESFRQVLARVGFSVFVALAAAFFALPMLWLVFAPFDPTPTLAARPAGPTLANFRDVFQNPLVLTSLSAGSACPAATCCCTCCCCSARWSAAPRPWCRCSCSSSSWG